MQRIVAEHVAGAANGIAHGHRFLVDLEIDLRLVCQLVQRGCQPATRGIAEATHIGRSLQHVGDQVVQRRRIAFNVGGERQRFAATHDGDAMVAKRSAHDHLVARLAVCSA